MKRMAQVFVGIVFGMAVAQPALGNEVSMEVANTYQEVALECTARGDIDPCMCDFASAVARELRLQELAVVASVFVSFYTAVDESHPVWGVVVTLKMHGQVLVFVYGSRLARGGDCLKGNDPKDYVRSLQQAFNKVATMPEVEPSQVETPGFVI